MRLKEEECSNCEEFGYECTYIESAKRRGPPKGYIESLEQRCIRLERVLSQVSQNIKSGKKNPLPWSVNNE